MKIQILNLISYVYVYCNRRLKFAGKVVLASKFWFKEASASFTERPIEFMRHHKILLQQFREEKQEKVVDNKTNCEFSYFI